jgi:phosphotransferase system HPr (HPr) family protein
MKKVTVTIPWREGLHLRPTVELVKLAKSFRSTISLQCGAKLADARSVLSIMLLCASMGTVLDVEVTGDDEQQAAEAVESVFVSDDKE